MTFQKIYLFLQFIQTLIVSGGIFFIHWVTVCNKEIYVEFENRSYCNGWKLGIWIFETLLIESYKLSDFLKYLEGMVLIFKHIKWFSKIE